MSSWMLCQFYRLWLEGMNLIAKLKAEIGFYCKIIFRLENHYFNILKAIPSKYLEVFSLCVLLAEEIRCVCGQTGFVVRGQG